VKEEMEAKGKKFKLLSWIGNIIIFGSLFGTGLFNNNKALVTVNICLIILWSTCTIVLLFIARKKMQKLIGDLEQIFPNEHLMKYVTIAFMVNFIFWQIGSIAQLSDNFLDASGDSMRVQADMDIALSISYVIAYLSDLSLCCIVNYITIKFSTPNSQD
jgi:hypothetical protein